MRSGGNLLSSWQMAVFSLLPHTTEKTPWGVSLIRAQIPFLGAPPHNIIISQKPHPLTLSYWGLGLQQQNFGGDKTLQLISYCQTIINTSDSFPPQQLSCLLTSFHSFSSSLPCQACHFSAVIISGPHIL